MNDQQARDEILSRIRGGSRVSQPLPDVPSYAWAGNPLDNFLERLIAFDGRAVKFKTRPDAVKWLLAQDELDAAKHVIYSTAQGIDGNFGEHDMADPGNARKIETCVTEGELAVGETCSIWVTNKSLGHAACALLARHLFIFVDSTRIVGGMHEAYGNISLRDQQYGCFFSGPSATADIEAVHITGAQGPLALTALIYNCQDAGEPQLLVNPHADHSVWQESM